MSAAVVLRRPPGSEVLADNAQYTNRLEIRSESSDRVYVIAQHKSSRWWSCSCFGWIRYRKCKHLDALGLPGQQKPFEATLDAVKKAVR